jgi:hypothetical protein
MKNQLFSKLLGTAAAMTTVLSVSVAPAAAQLAPAAAQLDSNPYYEDFLQFADGLRQEEGKSFEDTKDNIVGSLSNPGTWVDLNNLTLKHDSDVKVFLLGEGANQRNKLSVKINGEQKVLFQDASAAEGDAADWLEHSSDRAGSLVQGASASAAEMFGVEKISAGSSLEFLLTNKKYQFGSSDNITYSSFTDNNEDGLSHAFGYAFGGRYMLVGFEDLYGKSDDFSLNYRSDRDFNDTVFVFDMGEGNLAATPEPTTTFALFSVGGAGLLLLRRRQQDKPKS